MILNNSKLSSQLDSRYIFHLIYFLSSTLADPDSKDQVPIVNVTKSLILLTKEFAYAQKHIIGDYVTNLHDRGKNPMYGIYHFSITHKQ